MLVYFSIVPCELIFKPVSEILITGQFAIAGVAVGVLGIVIRREWAIVAFKSELAAQAAK